MRKIKKVLAIMVVLVLSMSMVSTINVSAAKKVKLNKTKATIYVGKTVTLKLKNKKNNKKKVKWSSSNKKVAIVTKKGKVKGKKAGKVTITAKVGKKKYKCKVTVKKRKQNIKKVIPVKEKTEKVISVKEKIKKACITYGETSSNMSGTYYYLSRATVSDSMSWLEYYTSVMYFPSQDLIRISVLTEDTNLEQDWMTTFDIININDLTCKIWYSDSFNNYGEGIAYKKLIHQDKAVDFYNTDMVDDVITISEDATSDIRIGLLDFDYIMEKYSVGVSSYDLGFTTLYSRYNN